jgi:hypothetical protein
MRRVAIEKSSTSGRPISMCCRRLFVAGSLIRVFVVVVGGVLDNDTLYPLILDGPGVVLIHLLTPHASEFGLGGQSAHSGSGTSITNTVRYTAMSPEPFKDIWR